MQTVGKFEIQQVLGRGASAVVYLASDPVLRRPVALKLLKTGGAGSGSAMASLLNEARACGQLKHPHIVPVYEAGESAGRPYLAFEYVDGRTLTRLLKDQGAMAPQAAAQMMCGILDALQHAHDAGLVHRDLKPSNILISADGQPHVMDFGIAARIIGDAGQRELSGTPAYMAPEYIRDGTIGPQGDVFAAGLVLIELLTGRPAIAGDNAFQAMHQIANTPLVMPDGLDQALVDIVAKATARDPSLRYPSARAMREALQAYLKPPETESADDGKARASTLDFLLRRMRQKSDFPAMSAAISTINRLAVDKASNATQLSASILKDFALTNKILRLANSAFYPQLQGNRISTVSRAVVVLGFDTVRSIAISLMLFEHMQDKRQAHALRDEFLRANLAGMLARDLAPHARADGEEAFICALFHNLGRLLAHYYFHEEAQAVDRLVASESLSEDQAARRVLGMSYEALGIGVAESWEFAPALMRSMRRPAPGPLGKPADAAEALGTLSSYAYALAQISECADPVERGKNITTLNQRYQRALPQTPRATQEAVERSLVRLKELADALGVDLRKTAFAPPPAAAGTPAPAATPALPGHLADPAAIAGGASREGQAESVLSAGIQDLTQALVEDLSLDDLLRIVAETLFRAIPVQRVLICTRDSGSGQMRARFGLGAEIEETLPRFRFPIGGADLFNLILARDVDVLIANTGEAKVQKHLPEWYRRGFTASSFIVFPMKLRGAPAAMLYADHRDVGGIAPTDKELALMRTLRNQAVLALKQAL